MAFQGGPKAEQPWPVEGIWLFPGPTAVAKHTVALRHAKYNINYAEMNGYEKTMMQMNKIRETKAAL